MSKPCPVCGSDEPKAMHDVLGHKPQAFTPGDVVEWKAAGKGARADGRAGTMVRGTVVSLSVEDGETWLHVRGHFPSMFHGHVVPAKKARRVHGN